jgi:hypothetical protein
MGWDGMRWEAHRFPTVFDKTKTLMHFIDTDG